jgi:hypothetical protein
MGMGVGMGLPTIDPNAAAFIAAAGITDPTQKDAINTLVVTLKQKSLWSSLVAIYPIVGGTASTHKWNLKDPRDLDAAFRLNIGGGWTHNASGMTGNGTTNYADTFCNAGLPHQTPTAGAYGLYCSTSSVAASSEMGALFASNSLAATRQAGDLAYCVYGDAGFTTTPSTDGAGFFNVNRNGGNTEVWRNGVKIGDSAVAYLATNATYYLGAANNSGTPFQPSARPIKFGFIFAGTLTAQNQADLYAAVLAYQTALGRA